MKARKNNIAFLILSLLVLSIVVLHDVNYLDYKAPIPYADWKQIKWSDFKGLKRPFETLKGNSEFAFIETEIRASYSTAGDLQVTTYFHPSRSYVFNQNVMAKDLLRHELYHLHITEYVARQMRQELKVAPNLRPDLVDATLKEYKLLEFSLQESYDLETEHNFLLGAQKKWEARIDSSLNAMINFSKPTINENIAR